ncbi:probable 6-phosphogluconolactonase 2 [Pyrus communis]|uniref:probable 6-phosphogluconolactonase 2 n=1 Tax=Pyrus communis TaxID=23211 RepID=UPI0035BFF4FB
MTFGTRSAIFSASKPGCAVRMASICSPTRLSLSLRTTLSSLRTSRAPGISLRSSPISLSLSIKPVRSNFKNPVSASSASAETAGQCPKKVEKFQTEEEVAVRLAKYTADLSAKFVKERGAFTVVLSGGSLIYTLRKLAEEPYKYMVEWEKWHVFWVDERVVKRDHADSNYKLALEGLLCKVPIPPGQVYAINDALPAEGAAEDYETCLKHLVERNVIATSKATGFPKFDLMLLGMGPDGHLASLFPGHPLCNEKTKWVTHITDSPKPPPERITFTFPVINSAAYNAMVVTGDDKADAVQRALGNSQHPDTLPVQSLAAEDELTWFLDQGAASRL